MASISGIVVSAWEVLKTLVPTGVEPVLFYTTFIITAALIFAIAQVITFFKENKALAMIIAVVISYFTASSAFVTIMVSKLFPNIGLAIMAIVGVMLVLVFLAPEKFKEGLGVSPIIGLGIFLVIIWLTWIFAAPALASSGILAQIQGATGFGVSNEDVTILIIAAVVIGGLYFLFKGKDETKGESFFDKLFKVYRK
jgi:hypothetical protein